ncbi:MAG: RDD family protein [Saprospiraceae bacterium]|nr:RDD family protein [Saprospiraceae bacterium]MCF8252496.1 RDD family protein [Saprospiraceae bacterium]MCF8282520.1 RDD family protein [Bacteroidales bacterium]MCF8314115.1 RDD family protein [Saprospiraceae bacterium]MCF8442850.1 RDD family protein [Saprospiraceae bacterium]
MRRFCSFFFLFLLAKMASLAQVSGKAVVDSTHMLVGDQMRLRIELSAQKDAELQPLNLKVISADSVFEVLAESKWDTLGTSGDQLRLQKNLLFIAWDSGYHRMPAIPVAYKLGGRMDTFFTRDIPIQISLPQVDTTLADIKPILTEPVKLQDYIWYILGVLALVLAVVLVLVLRKRKKILPPPSEPVVQLLPHELALQQLDSLAQQQMWQNGQVKGYHSALTYIVREYLENRYGIQALEQTTDEILEQLHQRDFDLSLSQKLGDVLQTADLVKFAKAEPGAEFHVRAMEVARGFVIETKPTEAQVQEMKALAVETVIASNYNVSIRPALELAGFWQRCFARIIDLIAFYLVLQLAILGFAYVRSLGINLSKIVMWFIPVLFVFFYHVYFEYKTGSTVGKMLLGIKVVDRKGHPISFGQSNLRTICKFLFAELLLVGYAFYFFDKKMHQTLHDRIAKTLVVKQQKTSLVTPKPKIDTLNA